VIEGWTDREQVDPSPDGPARRMSEDGETALAIVLPRSGWHHAREPLRILQSWSQRNGLFYAYAALVVFFTVSSSRFFTGPNIRVILLQSAVFGMIAVPGAMLILSGYVDLSVGSVAAFCSIIFGELVVSAGMLWWVALIVTLILGLMWGLVQGYLIAYLSFSPIVVTLGGLAAARGVGEFVSTGQQQSGFGAGFGELGNGRLLGVEVPIWISAVAFLVGAWIWYQMPYGRRMTAIGSDPDVARSLGIAVRRIPLVLYCASALAASVGGLIVTSQLDGSALSVGQSWELQVLTGILLGGVAFTGGRGSLFGVLIGILFIGTLTNGLIVININPYIQNVAVGGALVFAAALDVLYQRLDRVPVSDDVPVGEPKRAMRLRLRGPGAQR
jgi:ribose/xylose/arabinose/galactoside ABC-type transport system permease subunit